MSTPRVPRPYSCDCAAEICSTDARTSRRMQWHTRLVLLVVLTITVKRYGQAASPRSERISTPYQTRDAVQRSLQNLPIAFHGRIERRRRPSKPIALIYYPIQKRPDKKWPKQIENCHPKNRPDGAPAYHYGADRGAQSRTLVPRMHSVPWTFQACGARDAWLLGWQPALTLCRRWWGSLVRCTVLA